MRSLQLALERRIVDNLTELGEGFGMRVHAEGDGLVGCVPVVDISTVLETRDALGEAILVVREEAAQLAWVDALVQREAAAQMEKIPV